jgi:hypothetical protein
MPVIVTMRLGKRRGGCSHEQNKQDDEGGDAHGEFLF